MLSTIIGDIRKIENGFIFKDRYTKEMYFKTSKELFQHLLLEMESRSIFFGDNSYGYVHVFEKPNETHTSPSEVEPA